MRDIIEVIEVFQSIYDQYAREEGMIEAEICRHLNTAMTSIMTDHFKNKHKIGRRGDGPPYGYESDQYSNEDFSPLIQVVNAVPSSTGQLLISDVRAELPEITIRREEGEIEVRQSEIFHYDYVERWDPATDEFRECRWVKGNDVSRNKRNPFRQATDKYPQYRESGEHLQFYPEADSEVIISLVREHPFMWYDPSDLNSKVDFELNNRMMVSIVHRALSSAGVGVRDSELYQMVENESIKQ